MPFLKVIDYPKLQVDILISYTNIKWQTEPPPPYGNQAWSCNFLVCSFLRSILLLWILQESNLSFIKHCYIFIDTENLSETSGGYLGLIVSNLELFL